MAAAPRAGRDPGAEVVRAHELLGEWVALGGWLYRDETVIRKHVTDHAPDIDPEDVIRVMEENPALARERERAIGIVRWKGHEG